MANVAINLSAAIINTSNAGKVVQAADMGTVFDQFSKAEQGFADVHNSYTSATRAGSDLTIAYADGASSKLGGVTTTTQTATLVNASATSTESLMPGALRSSASGVFDVAYGSQDGAERLTYGAATINEAKLATLLPATSPLYDATLGNVTAEYKGKITMQANGDFAGVVTQFKSTAEKFVQTGTIDGNFTIAGNAVTIGSGSTSTAVSGTATSYVDKYYDGSLVSATGLSMPVTEQTVFDYTMLANPFNFTGHDVFDVALGAALATPLQINSGAGDDKLTVAAGGTAVAINAGTGTDRIVLKDFGMTIDGGTGIDTVEVSGVQSAYSLGKLGAAFKLAANEADNMLTNVERVTFSDISVALDIAGNGGQAYRIYEAAFNRAPDAAGAGYWISVLDGGRTIAEVATGFVASAEFKSLYGANPTNKELVSALYVNVLNRAGEQAGIDYWVGVLDSKAAPVSDVLMYFSEGAENQAATIATIGNGFAYTPYG